MYRKVEGHSGLVKSSSGAVVNVDPLAYERAKKKKKERQRLDNLEQRMENIENLLIQLVNK